MPFTLTMPKLSPTMEEGTIAKWHVAPGIEVKSGDLLFEVSTDKATVEYNALDGGWLKKILAQEGATVSVNQPVAVFTLTKDERIEGYEPEGEKSVASPVAKTIGFKMPSKKLDEPKLKVKASPLAKRIAKEQGMDLLGLTGSGPGGRIMSRDLALAPGEEALSPVRKVIALRLQEAKSTIPHFYVTIDVDADVLVRQREALKKEGHKITYNDFVVKAVALALKNHPEINSGFNPKRQTILRFEAVDVSVAVSVESGLITPIVFAADQKSVFEISTEIRQLAEKAKQGKLKLEEFQGGSFTVSNLGMYRVKEFSAIINPPQAAILAVGAVLEVPVVKKGQIVIGHTMSLTLSVDHRVIDGVLAAKFLNSLKNLLENPL